MEGPQEKTFLSFFVLTTSGSIGLSQSEKDFRFDLTRFH